MAKNHFQYGGWNSYTLQCGTIVTLISPGDCTCNVACGSGIVSRDSEFTKWQHPAMWYVVVGWHGIEFAQTSALLEFYIWFRFRPHHRAVDMSFCTSLRNVIQIGHPRQKIMTSCQFSKQRVSAILDFRDPLMGSLKSPINLLNCLVFQKIAFLHFGNRQTDRRTDGHAAPTHWADLAVASGGLIINHTKH